MSTRMKTRLIKIGNSQGIRIPNLLVEQAGLVDEVEVEAESGKLTICPAHTARQGWDEQFRAMVEAGDDRLLDSEPLIFTGWEASEWEW
jgi:antitoxin MazE